ncbi:MAG: hypothetical protein G8345_16045 [Magnetococcales bacterium]|nr:peptidylprolyl isomerase [Magnetococcales bacterium]NGZ28386.1 hypothetical protein [Magnetococcales bacterium]
MQAHSWKLVGISLLALTLSAGMAQAGEAPASENTPAAAATAPKAPPFAVVDGQEISGERYRMALQQGMQQKYYHGQIPAGELAKTQRDVGNQLIDRLLLLKEAEKRGLKADQEEISKATAQYDQRYANSPVWKENREKMLATVVEELTARSVLKQLEQEVRKVADPTPAEVEAYYRARPERFTEPEDRKISVILLRVDPSAGSEAWSKAQEEAKDLVKKLRGGSDFAEMARIHSGDTESAEKGGQMKKTHKGMLAPSVEAAVDKMKVGEISEPITVLEGVVIIRLDKKVPPTLMDYDDDARKRSTKHILEERSDQAWQGLKTRLRNEASIQINEKDYYAPMPPEQSDNGQKKKEGPVK